MFQYLALWESFLPFLLKKSQQLAFTRQLSVTQKQELRRIVMLIEAKMSHNVVKTHKNTADCVKKSQQLEFNRELSVDKDLSTY